jgi:glutamate-1-semialdehyde 2,1-aminomutase
MEQLAPLGPVYQAGTLSGNPVATACGLATLKEIQRAGFWDSLTQKTQSLVSGLAGAAKDAGLGFSGDSQGGMFGFFLLPELPTNYPQVMKSDGQKFNQLFHGLLDKGVYIAPALYEAGFVSAAHTLADIDQTISIAHDVMRAIK